MPSTAETDAEDVNDFLKRIQELGTKRDQEDEERNKKLEEEILQGRKERQARRAERARSISPLKDSPANTPLSYKSPAADSPSQLSNAAFISSRELQPPSQPASHGILLDDTMERLTGERSPTKEKTTTRLDTRNNGDTPQKAIKLGDTVRTSPSSAMPSRGSTLSWQRRPTFQASDQPKTRPLSMIATENAARSPRATPEPSPLADDTAPMARDAIAQSLASKDPTWFRQTADRGQSSAAYRKTQVEDKDIAEAPLNTARMQLPGMSRPMNTERDTSHEADGKDIDRSSSPSRNSSSNGSAGLSSFGSTASTRTTIGSPAPTTSAQWLPPPASTTSSDGIRDQTIRGLAMSPSQGRISPERLDRPISPTKGMGGFVQSAMMKRSDSVNKRWSVQSPGVLSRGNSIASNRSSQDLASTTSLGNLYSSLTREPRPSNLSRESTPLSTSRPGSSHSNATIVPDGNQPSTSTSLRSTMVQPTKDDGFVRPSLPASKSQPSLGTSSKEPIDRIASPTRNETPQPLSPSKTGDTRRWSPTKSSWLESALNKPDSPKPKPVAPQQPSWMSEINKAKQKTNPDSSTSVTVKHKHQVSIGGLLRSPAMGGPAKPLSVGGLPAGFSSGVVQKDQPRKGSLTDSALPSTILIEKKKSIEPAKSVEKLSRSETPKSSDSVPTSSPASGMGKVKPETPPKKDLKDFRASLKPRQLPPDTNGKEEPEFKNVFGQLRRTKTQNYVAPDELKENILRGKVGLNPSGGPKKTELKDDFKEAILKKKEAFKKAQLEGTGVVKGTTNAQEVRLPEALLKKASLGRSNTMAPGNRDSKPVTQVSADFPLRNRLPSNPAKPSLLSETSAPGILQGNVTPGSKLADRFNPALAGLLARGGPPPADESTAKTVVSSSEKEQRITTKVAGTLQESGPQLTHMTKGRARGPRRKAPSAVAAVTESKDCVE